ncbi:MAG: alpha/beta fold hydrolase, partial [Vicinamibacterales bacterium]
SWMVYAGQHVRPLPRIRGKGVSGEKGSQPAIGDAHRNVRLYASARLRKAARAAPPELLVTGERTHALFLLITAALERCLEGESHAMVPEAGHGMHQQNPTFYNDAVMAFLRRAVVAK